MAHESQGRGWLEVLGALPLPAAVLDADYQYVLLNRASAADPLLARARVGDTDLAGSEAEPVALERARERHRQYERSLRTQEPLFFEEATATVDGRRPRWWICVPVRNAGNTHLLVVGLGANLADAEQAEPEAMVQLLHKINRELRAPLAALVGLAGTLAHELSGEQQTRVSLIDQCGQRLLKHLSLLMDEAEKSPRSKAHHETSDGDDSLRNLR